MNKFVIDDLDKRIIDVVSEDATFSNAVVGEIVGLSASAVNERIRKLKAMGVICSIAAFINAQAVEKGLCAYIYVLVDKPKQSDRFLEAIIEKDEVLECHHITGEYSFLLKVRVKDTKKLENFITRYLKNFDGIIKTFTQIVLSSAKDKSNIIEVL